MHSSEGKRREMDLANRRCTGAKLLLVALMACLLTNGCGLDQWAKNGYKVGPNYIPPPAPIASNWIDYQQSPSPATTQPSELTQWWHVYDDPVLNSLISDAYKQNLSLRVAGERIEEARALRGIAVGNLFPQVQELSGSYSAVKTSDKVANAAPDQWSRNAAGGFNLSWELDFWGRFRRSIEAADASLEASIDSYDDVLVVLLSDVASDYIQYRTFQERLDLAHRNVHVQEDAYQLASDSFKLGHVTERDPQQAKQVLEQTRALIPQLEAGMRRTNNALCVLLGIPPQELAQRLGETGTIPVGQPEWSTGIPADLLRRRPDVRQAERETAAQSAQIGIAKADLYPRFSLDGSIGVQSQELGDLFHTPGSMAAFGGPSFRWNILNYGRIESSVEAQEALFRQFFSQYQAAVLQANQEAEDAMIDYVKSQEQTEDLEKSVDAAERTVEITYDQYRHGAVDFTAVFIFESALTTQQDDLAQARGDVALNLVALYRALGGGWNEQNESSLYEAPPVPAPTTQHADVARPTTMPGTNVP